MKFLRYGLLALLALLSLAAGIAKLLKTPEEVAFFASAGLAKFWLFPLGAVQVAGAGLAAFARTRSLGLGIIAAGFLVSSIVIFVTGNMVFGLVSLVPVALTLLMLRLEGRD